MGVERACLYPMLIGGGAPMAKRITVRWLLAVGTAAALAAGGAGLQGCGSDDTNGGTGDDAGGDATTDHATPIPEAGPDTNKPDAGPDSGCAAPATSCGSACADLSTDPAHCGSCTYACPTGATCAAGRCSTDIKTVAAD